MHSSSHDDTVYGRADCNLARRDRACEPACLPACQQPPGQLHHPLAVRGRLPFTHAMLHACSPTHAHGDCATACGPALTGNAPLALLDVVDQHVGRRQCATESWWLPSFCHTHVARARRIETNVCRPTGSPWRRSRPASGPRRVTLQRQPATTGAVMLLHGAVLLVAASAAVCRDMSRSCSLSVCPWRCHAHRRVTPAYSRGLLEAGISSARVDPGTHKSSCSLPTAKPLLGFPSEVTWPPAV
jgi:hypothetical protein